MRFYPLVALLLASSANAQLTQRERKGVEDTLYLGNMNVKDLGAFRPLTLPPKRFSLLDQVLEKPLDAADTLLTIHAKGDGTLASLLAMLSKDVYGDIESAAPTEAKADIPPVGIPEALHPSIAKLIDAVSAANAMIREATAKLTKEERRSLIETLPRLAALDTSINFDFVKQPMLSTEKTNELLSKVNLSEIRFASVLLSKRIQDELPKLRALAKTTKMTGSVRFASRGVTVEVSGQENDTHTSRDTNLSIDLGGTNTYTGRYGAGIDYASVMIDCGKDSVFDGPDLNMGSGLLGIGLAYVLGGNNRFVGKLLCFGSGIAGVGALYKDGGNDTYRSTALSQGFGMYGIGLLLDSGGNDHYEGKGYVQGSARTLGVGWLVDQAGDNIFRAAGLLQGSPFFPGVTRSNSQGWSSGFENGATGGLGLVTCLGGRNTYIGDSFCQAVGERMGIGSIYDSGPGDTFSAHNHAQSFASRAGGSFLFELGGDNNFTVNRSVCHAFGQESGVAFLLSRESNSIFAANDSRPGTGNANGVGIFLATDGENRYMGPPASGNGAHGTGSIGLFCDLGGPTKFASGLADGEARVDDTWAVAFAAGETRGDIAVLPDTEIPKPGSLPLVSPPELEALYKQATATGVGPVAKERSEAIRTFVGMGAPALKWLFANKLPTATPTQIQALASITRLLADAAKDPLKTALTDPSDAAVAKALSVVIEAKAKTAGPMLPELFKRTSIRRLVTEAAGVLEEKSCLSELMTLAGSQDPVLVRYAMIALAAIGDESAAGTAQPFLKSTDIQVRKAAISLLGKSPKIALVVARQLLSENDEPTQRTAIEILAASATDEALTLAGQSLTSPLPGVRIQALLALNGRIPVDLRAKAMALRNDPSALVRAVAKRIDVGR